MSQHDYILDNQAGASFRADLNNALAATVGANNGLTAPATTYAFMAWMDTTANLLKRRNSADNAWVTIASFNGTTWIPYRSGAVLGDAANRTVGTAALSDLPDIEDVQNQQGIYLLTGGSAGAYTLTLIPAISGYVEGQRFVGKANHANPGASTLNVNAKGAGAITWPNGDAMVLGDILVDQHFMVQRTASGFMMLGSRSVASQAEAEAGTQNTRLMTPLRTKQAIDALNAGLILDTKQATTSGTAIDFTGIPAGVKRIMINFEGVSLSGSDDLIVQLGDSVGFETSGYLATGSNIAAIRSSTAGFIILEGLDSNLFSGIMILSRMDASALWVASHSGKSGTANFGGGDKTLSDELTQIRLTRTGSDTFDAGSVNIMYE